MSLFDPILHALATMDRYALGDFLMDPFRRCIAGALWVEVRSNIVSAIGKSAGKIVISQGL